MNVLIWFHYTLTAIVVLCSTIKAIGEIRMYSGQRSNPKNILLVSALLLGVVIASCIVGRVTHEFDNLFLGSCILFIYWYVMWTYSYIVLEWARVTIQDNYWKANNWGAST